MDIIDLISDALLEIGVINESETPSAEQGAHALRKLNQMLEEWEESSVRLGWSEQTSTGDTAPLPPYAERGVTLSLALALAPSYGGAASVSDQMMIEHRDAMAVINRKAALKNLTESDSRNLPAAESGLSTYNITTG